jgi:AcrR family transcriptional regulator
MQKADTKQKIIDAAVKMFNQQGYAAVSLHELAQHIGMSRGNLAYHFKTKEELLKAISQQLWDGIRKEREKSRQLPSFENLHNEVQIYYRFQKRYAFIFLDTHVLKHPAVKSSFREMTRQTLLDFQAAIAFSIKSGNMKPETVPGIYNNLALSTWMLAFFWSAQQIIRGEQKAMDGEKIIWSNLWPHLTEKGQLSFKKFFGEDYVKQLGEPFSEDISEIIPF